MSTQENVLPNTETITYESVKEQVRKAVTEFLPIAKLKKGDIFIVGCSSSEIGGFHIGKGSNENLAEAVLEGLKPVLDEQGIFLAAQCCEHLNRAIVIPREALASKDDLVNVVPQKHAGGSFATALYHHLEDPVVVEHIKADAGFDIGDTLIGMHLRPVAVPVRLSLRKIGAANLVCARTRPKYIGGERAVYDVNLSGGEVRD
ncbi:MAG: TIGR01440 family protein [Lachnospiraceae bacterium]|nr:TIGR01440 family protein [Lachnospiraceae bacterium]